MTIDEFVEFDDLNKEVKEMQAPEKAAETVERYEDILKMKIKEL